MSVPASTVIWTDAVCQCGAMRAPSGYRNRAANSPCVAGSPTSSIRVDPGMRPGVHAVRPRGCAGGRVAFWARTAAAGMRTAIRLRTRQRVYCALISLSRGAIGPPNESRLSCGAELKGSQTEFYNTERGRVTRCREHGRRQLQALVRRLTL